MDPRADDEDDSTIAISPFQPEDRERWEVLAHGYNRFYETVRVDAEYHTAWERLLRAQDVHGLAARLDGNIVGIAHYLFHASTWSGDVCYLQDLFVAEAARGQGIARRLIESVAEASNIRGAVKLYWQTKHDNTTARALYDKVAVNRGFIRYDYVALSARYSPR